MSNLIKLFLLTIMITGFTACISEDDKSKGPLAPGMNTTVSDDPANLTTIEWLDSVLTPGSVIEGQKLEVSFRFRNSGDKPLVIESAQPSCGCTIPAKPEEPILPGQQGIIKAIFDSKGRAGMNHKTITVRANTKPNQSHIVEFNVDVIGKTDGPKPAATSQQQF